MHEHTNVFLNCNVDGDDYVTCYMEADVDVGQHVMLRVKMGPAMGVFILVISWKFYGLFCNGLMNNLYLS